MDKFNDIKVGDPILVLSSVNYGSGLKKVPKIFMVKATVDRITPKRFYVGKYVYNKSNGVCIGSSSSNAYQYNVDDDQTAEYNEFWKSVDLYRKSKYSLSKLDRDFSFNPNSSLEHNVKINELILELSKLIDNDSKK